MGSGDTWLQDYTSRNMGEEELHGVLCWKVQLDAIIEKEPSYSMMIAWIHQEDYLPLQVDYYDEEGEMMKSLYIDEFQNIEGTPTPMKITMRSHVDGTETRMEVLSMTYQWEPPVGYFSERNLKN